MRILQYCIRKAVWECKSWSNFVNCDKKINTKARFWCFLPLLKKNWCAKWDMETTLANKLWLLKYLTDQTLRLSASSYMYICIVIISRQHETRPIRADTNEQLKLPHFLSWMVRQPRWPPSSYAPDQLMVTRLTQISFFVTFKKFT